MAEWKKGDLATLGYDGKTVPCEILIASANSRSLMLSFEAVIDGHVRSMPVLLDDAGVYRSIVTWFPITLAVRTA